MTPLLVGNWGPWWEVVELNIGHAWGVRHHWGIELALWGGCRASLLDIALLQEGTLEPLKLAPGKEED